MIGMRARPEIALWSGGAPGAVGDSLEDRPAITPYLPPAGKANGTAAIIFAGGGYGHIAFEKEGVPAARWLNSIGVTAFVVRYRLGPRYHHPTMLQDAARAVRLVRARAGTWALDAQRIGVVGFSAGGHLASTVGTHFDAGSPTSADPIERVSSRPDYMILVYPVISMLDGVVHKGSRRRLIGDSASLDLQRLLSNELQVSRETPPTFLVASTDDNAVPVDNSLRFYQAMKAAKVPVELHVFEAGAHGFGLAPDDPALSMWPSLGTAWMRRHGWLAPSTAAQLAR